MSKTYGDQYREALACKTREEATDWLKREVERYATEFGIPATEAVRTIRINLGYMTGYGDSETAQRIFTFFDCQHPYFGTSRPSTEEALAAGKAAAR